jgi:uncharacterized lipoprotein YmbA
MDRPGRFPAHFAIILILPVLLALCGCLGGAGISPRTFLLTASQDFTDMDGVSRMPLSEHPHVRVGVGPAKIPEYLNRPQIVSRAVGSEVNIEEYHRWAEPFKDGLPRIVVDHLSSLLGTDQVFVFPWRGIRNLDYRVTMDILRFDGTLGGDVSLEAVWTLFEGDKGEAVKSTRSSFTVPCRGDGYEELVEAHNQLLFLLSYRIAETIEGHMQPTGMSR